MRRVATILLVLVAMCFSDGFAQECGPDWKSGTGAASPYWLEVDGEARSSHTNLATGLRALKDTLWLRPEATVYLRASFAGEWLGYCGEPAAPDTIPEDTTVTPEPEPEPDPDPDPPPEFSDDLTAIMGVPQYSDFRTAALTSAYVGTYEYWEPRHDEREHKWEVSYYDRGYGYYGAYWRSGDESYLAKGHEWVQLYRDGYVLPNNGAIPPRWLFPEGLAAHYLMTGDSRSLEAVTKACQRNGSWITHEGNESILDTSYRDGRIQGRAWLCQSIMYALTGEQQYADLADLALTDMLTWFDEAGGNGRWDSCALPGVTCNQTTRSYCGGMAPFQVAHAILDGFVRHHELVGPVDRLGEVLDKTLDFMWGYWTPGEGFAYIVPPEIVDDGSSWHCEGSGGNGPAKDVTALIATAYAYGAQYTGAQRHADRWQELWTESFTDEGLDIFYSGNKQFNQSFFRTWRDPYLTNQ